MIATFRKLIELMTPQERRRFYLLLVLIMGMGIAEMLSVAAILPFLAVVARPGIAEGTGRLAQFYDWMGFASREQFLVFLGGSVFALVVVGLLYSTLTQYAIFRFAGQQSFSISSRLLRGYLHRPYTWFLNHHSAKLGASVLSEVGSVISQAMLPAMRMLSQLAVVLFLVALLVIARPGVAGRDDERIKRIALAGSDEAAARHSVSASAIAPRDAVGGRYDVGVTLGR